jgi:hypothetical protein
VLFEKTKTTTISAIARELEIDRKTVSQMHRLRLESPLYGRRKPRKRLINPFVFYLRERVAAYPGLTGRRLWRDLRERGPSSQPSRSPASTSHSSLPSTATVFLPCPARLHRSQRGDPLSWPAGGRQ